MLLGLSKAVGEFHRQNPPLSHNDIKVFFNVLLNMKPGNLLVSNDDEVLLFDFGSVNVGRHAISSRRVI